jgi:hypothetical protein
MKYSQHSDNPAPGFAHGEQRNGLYRSQRFRGKFLTARSTPVLPVPADAKLFAWLLTPGTRPPRAVSEFQ